MMYKDGETQGGNRLPRMSTRVPALCFALFLQKRNESRKIFVTLPTDPKNNTIMSTNVIQQTIADYLKAQPIQRAWLFGSFARGEETPLSDVDLLVQYDATKRASAY